MFQLLRSIGQVSVVVLIGSFSIGTSVRADEAKTAYHIRFMFVGYLLRASNVCDNHPKHTIRTAFASINYPELKTIAKSFPKLTAQWMGEGSARLNSEIMSEGLSDACKHAVAIRDRIDKLGS